MQIILFALKRAGFINFRGNAIEICFSVAAWPEYLTEMPRGMAPPAAAGYRELLLLQLDAATTRWVLLTAGAAGYRLAAAATAVCCHDLLGTDQLGTAGYRELPSGVLPPPASPTGRSAQLQCCRTNEAFVRKYAFYNGIGYKT